MAQKIAVFEAGQLARHIKRTIALLLIRRQMFEWRAGAEGRAIQRCLSAPVLPAAVTFLSPIYLPGREPSPPVDKLPPAELPECRAEGPLANVGDRHLVGFANIFAKSFELPELPGKGERVRQAAKTGHLPNPTIARVSSAPRPIIPVMYLSPEQVVENARKFLDKFPQASQQ